MFLIYFQDTKLCCFFPGNRNSSNGNICAILFMNAEHLRKIHLIQLVAGKNEHMIELVILNMSQTLAHRICRTLEPLRVIGSLLSCHNIYKAGSESAELVSVFDMFVQRCRIVLREHKNPVDVGIDTV